jgi:hypothetical protein
MNKKLTGGVGIGSDGLESWGGGNWGDNWHGHNRTSLLGFLVWDINIKIKIAYFTGFIGFDLNHMIVMTIMKSRFKNLIYRIYLYKGHHCLFFPS